MSYPSTLPLFDERARPASWNERMQPGEYAVHYSSFDSSVSPVPTCTVLGSLAEAEEYAQQQVAQRPTLRCRIYDHHGFIGEPISEFRGTHYKGESEISPRFRRWVGSGLFFGGIALTIVDWWSDFNLVWPSTIGMRILLPGLALLVMEAMIVLHEKQKKHHATPGRAL